VAQFETLPVIRPAAAGPGESVGLIGAGHIGRLAVATSYAVPVEPLAGKIVIDNNNDYPQRDGQIPELDAARRRNSAETSRRLNGTGTSTRKATPAAP